MKLWYMISGILLAVALMAGCGADDSDGSGDNGAADSETTDSDGNTGDNNGTDSANTGENPIEEVHLSVDEDIPADELSEDELQDVCGDIYDVVSVGMADAETKAETFSCQATGIQMAQMTAMSGGSNADVVAACEQGMSDCADMGMDTLADSGSGDGLTEEEFCQGADESVESCTATAGEIADCMVAIFTSQFAALDTYMAQAPDCSDLTVEYFNNPSLPQLEPDSIGTPTECAAVAAKCPNMLSEME